MAKHEGELIADIDDGYMKVSNLLAEALCCMPLSGAELRVVWFIIRRTYGWVKRGDRSSGKMDLMTAATIADGTCMPKRTVQRCISVLCNKRIINSLQISSNNGMAYGINSRVEEWGNGDINFANTKAAMKDNQDFGIYKNSGEKVPDIQRDYTQKCVEVYEEMSIGLRKNEYTSTQKCVYQEPVSPCVARLDEVPKDSIKDIYKDSINDSLSEAHLQCDNPTENEAPKRVKKSPSERAKFNEELEAAIKELRDTFDASDLCKVDTFIDLIREHRANRIVAKTVIVNTMKSLLDLRQEANMTSEAFAYGIDAAVSNSVDNVNYVKKAARGYRPRNTSSGTTQRLQMSIRDIKRPEKTEVY